MINYYSLQLLPTIESNDTAHLNRKNWDATLYVSGVDTTGTSLRAPYQYLSHSKSPSHPGLGWLYAYSLFPLPRPRPPPTPQNITMTIHERHVILNHRSFNCLFNSLWWPTSKKHQWPHYWPFVRGFHRWPVNSPHKGPVTRKEHPFDDVIIDLNASHGETVWA